MMTVRKLIDRLEHYADHLGDEALVLAPVAESFANYQARDADLFRARQLIFCSQFIFVSRNDEVLVFEDEDDAKKYRGKRVKALLIS